MDAIFEIILEHVHGDYRCQIFRVAFASSTDRLLLPYPEVTGLHFVNSTGAKIAEWKTRSLATTPLDEFVLNPGDRISFDLKAWTNIEPDHERRWTIQLPAGQLAAQYHFHVEPDIERYDYLARRSRFAAITKPWGGSLESNAVQFIVPQTEARRMAK